MRKEFLVNLENAGAKSPRGVEGGTGGEPLLECGGGGRNERGLTRGGEALMRRRRGEENILPLLPEETDQPPVLLLSQSLCSLKYHRLIDCHSNEKRNHFDLGPSKAFKASKEFLDSHKREKIS